MSVGMCLFPDVCSKSHRSRQLMCDRKQGRGGVLSLLGLTHTCCFNFPNLFGLSDTDIVKTDMRICRTKI